MNRTTFLVDGFNLYHSVKDLHRDTGICTKWLNIRSLCLSFLYQFGKQATLEEIYYFSAYATHLNDPAVVARHKNYVDCLADTGIIPVMGNFKAKDMTCPICHQPFVRHEEKETDVAIAAKLLELLSRKACENVVLLTGDTDLVPAIECARRLSPNCRVFVAFPYKRKNMELAQLVPHFKIGRQSYVSHQFPDPFPLHSGISVPKPASW